MGGKIVVESEKGVGSEFSFSIPYRPAGSAKPKIALVNNEQVLNRLTGAQKSVSLSMIIRTY